jgi:DNA-binding CsgD family transcriptional regulator
MQFRADESEGYARRARDSALRFGLRPAATFALVFLSNAAAMRRDRDEMTRWADQAVAEAADGSDVPAHLELTSQGIYALITENREDALRHMDRGAAALNAIPASAPAMTRGLWALVREVAGRDGAQARAAVHASGVTVTRMNRACLAYAEAVELGRHGDGERAARLVAAGDADMPAGTESWRHLTHRLVAEAALADGWGEPIDWLVDALGCFESNGLGELAGACRSLLRAAGVRRPPRPHADVPNKLHRAGLTARETDVLRLIVEGLPNRDIAARLHLSPRTVEKHVEALLRKTNTRNRTELARTATEIRIPSSPDT